MNNTGITALFILVGGLAFIPVLWLAIALIVDNGKPYRKHPKAK